MARQITLREFSIGDFTFRQYQRLPRIERLTAGDLITEVVRNLPDTTTCEGALRDPRCPVTGNGDVINILLAALDARGEVRGALHFSAINLIEERGDILVVATHPTPSFPDMDAAEIASFIATAAQFVLSNDLVSFEGPTLQIRSLEYALETPFKSGGKFEAIHNALMSAGLEFETIPDSTRTGRELLSYKPTPPPPTRLNRSVK